MVLMFFSGCMATATVILDPEQEEYEGTFSFQSVNESSELQVRGMTLWHLEPKFQLGPSVTVLEQRGGGQRTSFSTIAAEGRYNFSTEGDQLPFVGGSLGIVTVVHDDGGSEPDVERGSVGTFNVGTRLPISPSAFVVLKLQYTKYVFRINDFSSDITESTGVFAGYAVRF
jgi:hypothetical protein